jgi:AraC family transcriptional regulator of adaptative response/methylated-DNA-[protein]-cysteine methyltransferase
MREPDETEWAELVGRNPHPGVYAVTTTGVVCRFGCASRAPLRRNVQVFDNFQAAVAAGFRRCLRCGVG